ncbi:MAG TPA: imidazole glycerol phosphate synthase subunit HisH [Chitinophagaceae bacterium]|nr:imidazole glycerol phosphate synthase subunit HisH [Chitinophagaceae bacterium]
MTIAIIRYNAGNIRSVLFALERMGCSALVTDRPEDILAADRVIFPGVGEASSAMAYLKERKLDQLIREISCPVLGICLGMQLMCSHSEENNTDCLGIFPESVRKFPVKAGYKVPQTGWNSIQGPQSPLFEGIPDQAFMYFVHSFYAELSGNTIARANYGFEYSAGLRLNHFFGVQFHPEKSAGHGERLLRNFLDLKV